VVPYLHIATRIEGHPYDNLYKEKGVRGFPTLQFMDADGNTLMKQGARSVAAFERSLYYMPRKTKLEAKVAAGEKGHEVDLFIARFALGEIGWEEASEQLKGFKKLTPAQKKELAPMLVDGEINHLVRSAGRDPEKVKKAGLRIEELLAGGARPSADVASFMWSFLLRYADQESKAGLYEKALAKVRKRYEGSDSERIQEYLKGLEARLAELKAGADG